VDYTWECATKVTAVQKGTEKIAYGYDGLLLTSDARTGCSTRRYPPRTTTTLTRLESYGRGDGGLYYDNDGCSRTRMGSQSRETPRNGCPRR